MKSKEAQQFATLACDVAREAGKAALVGFRQPMHVEMKKGTELVTNFDVSVEELICERLHALTPDMRVVSEELGGESIGDRIWYVDPIDGTQNYSRGHPFWSVSIGLVVRGVPVAGAVVAPALGLEWIGSMGSGAFRNESPCVVSETTELTEAFLATGFPYDRRTNADNNLDRFAKLKQLVLAIRRCGSAAIDLCFVADGTYDGYWETKLQPWDIAAGIAIVCAAGGQASSMIGSAPDLAVGEVAATNGKIHEALLGELGTFTAPGTA